VTLFHFLSLKNDVNVASKSNEQKKFKIVLKNYFFAGILKVNDENSRIRIPDPDPDPHSQRHGSADPDPDPPQNVMDPDTCLLNSLQF
jgi:hypothetical protein